MAFNQRNDIVKALGPLQTSVVLLIDDVNRELDRLEGDLKKLFPGQPDRVASYLAATRNSRSSGGEDPAPMERALRASKSGRSKRGVSVPSQQECWIHAWSDPSEPARGPDPSVE
jgi:hypothetical protein